MGKKKKEKERERNKKEKVKEKERFYKSGLTVPHGLLISNHQNIKTKFELFFEQIIRTFPNDGYQHSNKMLPAFETLRSSGGSMGAKTTS